jgi:hypothetical protein
MVIEIIVCVVGQLLGGRRPAEKRSMRSSLASNLQILASGLVDWWYRFIATIDLLIADLVDADWSGRCGPRSPRSSREPAATQVSAQLVVAPIVSTGANEPCNTN